MFSQESIKIRPYGTEAEGVDRYEYERFCISVHDARRQSLANPAGVDRVRGCRRCHVG